MSPRRHCAILLAGAAVCLAAGCREDSARPIGTVRKTLADSADQVLWGTWHLITERGLLRADVHSDTSFFFDDNTRLEMRVVQSVFFDAAGAKEAVMTARAGSYNTRTSMFEARGDVIITAVDGSRLESPFVRFDQRLNQISSDTDFVMTRPDQQIRGVGFKTDPDLQNIKVERVKSAKSSPVAVPER